MLSSCTRPETPVVIWTDRPELASYVELFNATHPGQAALVVYKDSPAHALPPAKDEPQPDLIIGSWLKNAMTRRYFSPMDYLFSEQAVSRAGFYPSLVEYGAINEKQYLLPVSFNLPAIILSAQYEDLLEDPHLITTDEIRLRALGFNQQNQGGTFTAMGFAPSWSGEFMYLVSRLQGADYRQKGTVFSWDEEHLDQAAAFLQGWTEQNGSAATEQNFQFKYLYMPTYRQVTTGRSLFAYVTSGELFTFTDEEASGLAFRWIAQDGKMMVSDDLVTMGLYRHARNTTGAEAFISWFCRAETQRQLLERVHRMNLDTVTFGIAGGFSALRDVNADVYPIYYRALLENLPSEEYFSLPNMLPYRWESLKARVIIPYLQESAGIIPGDEDVPAVVPLPERIEDWSRTAY